MPTKILFVPFYRRPFEPIKKAFQQVAGDEYTGPDGKNAHWMSVIAKRKAMVTEDPAELAKVAQMIEIVSDGRVYRELKRLNNDDQVYIRGHCVTGLESIFSYDDLVKDNSVELRKVFAGFLDRHAPLPRAEVLPAPVVANRLIASGLQQGFTGAIKCFNCHSGEPEDGSNFSRAFVTHLRKRGYTKCTVYGYIGALDSYPGVTNWKGDEPLVNPYKMHTFATQDYFVGENKGIEVLGRASKNRVVAKPYP